MFRVCDEVDLGSRREAAKTSSVIEIRDVRQNPNEPFRRWFSDEDFDLIVWYRPDESVDGFELCYDKTGHEKALRWFAGKGFSHHGVDPGDQSPLANRTPILLAANDKFDPKRVSGRFDASQAGLPDEVAILVRERLEEFGRLVR